MSEALRTILYLSLTGSAAVVTVTVLKAIAEKYVSAAAWYFMWLAALCCMAVPFLKAVPKHEAESAVIYMAKQMNIPHFSEGEAQMLRAQTNHAEEKSADLGKMLELIWITGCGFYLAISFGCYAVLLNKKRRTSIISDDDNIWQSGSGAMIY